MQDGSHSHPPEIDREMRPRGCPNSGFHGFPLLPFYWEMRKRICKTVLVNSVLFSCLLCVCLRDKCKWSSKQFKCLSRILAPLLAPEKEKGRKKEKEKKRMKGTLLWKKNLSSRRRGAQNKRWRKRKKKQNIIRRWRWHSKSARNTWTESQNSLAYQLCTLATRYYKMPLRDATFLDRSTETNVFSMNFNQEITISVVWAKRKKNI